MKLLSSSRHRAQRWPRRKVHTVLMRATEFLFAAVTCPLPCKPGSRKPARRLRSGNRTAAGDRRGGRRGVPDGWVLAPVRYLTAIRASSCRSSKRSAGSGELGAVRRTSAAWPRSW